MHDTGSLTPGNGAASRRKGLALTVGVNSVDPDHYSGWSGVLRACEADATAMARLAAERGFEVTTLLTREATRANLLRELERAARTLRPGDFFLLTYAGHGGQLPDASSDEEDLADETWCLHDAQLIDDELKYAWAAFAPGVRVLVVSDSCHSGTMLRAALEGAPQDRAPDETRVGFRCMPRDKIVDTYQAHQAFYDELLERLAARGAPEITAPVRLLAACKDDQLASDGLVNGLFTGMLLRVWDGGRFTGGYRELHAALLEHMPKRQTPSYQSLGDLGPAFDEEKPFTL